MAISNYTELQTALDNWLVRDDLSSRTPEFIALAEAAFNRDIRDRQMITTTTLTTVAGTATLALPSDFLEPRSFVLETTPKRVLSSASAGQIDEDYANGQTGQPVLYSIEGANVRFGPTPDSAYSVRLAYYQKIPALASNSTNWLLTNYPDIYLYGSLVSAEGFLMNDERIPVWGALLQRGLEGLGLASKRSEFGGGPLQTRVDIRAV
jgi:hypothetical protein